MIITVTPNPALDVTYDVERLVPHASHRVLAVREVAGGKGLNVASVLSVLGHDVLATGLVGGDTGARFRADLEARGIRHDLLDASVGTRRTVTVVSEHDGGATAFNEPGQAWDSGQFDALAAHLAGLLETHRPGVVVASGSVPPGFPPDGYAVLLRAARDAGCAVVLDASGDALLGGLGGEPDVVKPNRDELRAVTGSDDPVAGAKALHDKGARSVLVSLGEEGMVHVAADGGVTRARLAAPLRGNATGAGDAAVAALDTLRPWPEVLVDAVAWSAAAVLQPVAGVVSVEDVERLAPQVEVERQAG